MLLELHWRKVAERAISMNYRWRLGLAKGDPRYNDLEDQIQKAPDIAVPTII